MTYFPILAMCKKLYYCFEITQEKVDGSPENENVFCPYTESHTQVWKEDEMNT